LSRDCLIHIHILQYVVVEHCGTVLVGRRRRRRDQTTGLSDVDHVIDVLPPSWPSRRLPSYVEPEVVPAAVENTYVDDDDEPLLLEETNTDRTSTEPLQTMEEVLQSATQPVTIAGGGGTTTNYQSNCIDISHSKNTNLCSRGLIAISSDDLRLPKRTYMEHWQSGWKIL